MHSCKICKNEKGNTSYVLREMMFGFRDKFDYILCSRCGCLQIVTIPLNIDKYYPDNYYSFAELSLPKLSPLRLYFNRWVTILSLRGVKQFPLPKIYSWIKNAGITVSSKILDVGSGTGALLLGLYIIGFRNLKGIDPFIKRDYSYGNVVTIKKGDVKDVKELFDFVMLHHTLEHISDPKKLLLDIKEVLHPKGRLLIRIPIIPCFAWSKYKEDWIALDAPRHYYIHSLTSIALITENAGFKMIHSEYDSSGFQIWGSELYKRDVSYEEGKKGEIQKYSHKERLDFEKTAEFLNDLKMGDQVCLIFEKTENKSST